MVRPRRETLCVSSCIMLWINKLNLVYAAEAAFEDENAQIIGNLIVEKKKCVTLKPE